MIVVASISDEKARELVDGAIFATSQVSLGAFMRYVVHPILQSRIDQRFFNEGDDAVGGPWRPLTKNTTLIRRSKGFPGAHPINKRTGQLFHTIRNSHRITPGTGATLTIPDRIPKLVQEKLKVAQMGESGYPTPARPVLALGAADAARILPSLRSWIEQGGTR